MLKSKVLNHTGALISAPDFLFDHNDFNTQITKEFEKNDTQQSSVICCFVGRFRSGTIADTVWDKWKLERWVVPFAVQRHGNATGNQAGLDPLVFTPSTSANEHKAVSNGKRLKAACDPFETFWLPS